jgi:hypothetical protein
MYNENIEHIPQEITPTLDDFMSNEYTVLDRTETFVLSIDPRKEFTIKTLTPREFEAIRKRSVIVNNKGKVVSTSDASFQTGLIKACCVSPDFCSTKNLETNNCSTPEDLITKKLTAGEIMKLAFRIQKLSGLAEDMEDLIEEAKK